ncbi:MAG: uroporphyrinogen-III C-methyltransferase, partial [Synergistaceae bacterium]|nr:uroporphyrinogen-III C-methyltransferase [Synergistaceae bacterium]
MSVWLVGAGCGLPGLLTLSAAECLSGADHVVYDRLIHPDVLQLAPQGCRFHLAGKRERNHSMRQEEINELLVSLGSEGGTVVRLKGGDPFVFGRGGEEAEFLEKSAVPWRAIPGVTSAVGGAVTSGLPPTHRDLSSSVLLVTGHRRADINVDDDSYWQMAASAEGTVAIYMGASNFAAVADRLLSCGKPPDTPVSVVRWGGWNRASRANGTLGEIASMIRRGDIRGPSVIYFGAAAGITLSSESGLLRGMQVVICRPYPECWNAGRAIEAMGADCYGLPLLRFEELDVGDSGKNAIVSADWLVLTSPRGASRLTGLVDIRRIRGKVVAIGEGTSSALKGLGIIPDLVAGG